ncbi:Nuclear fusion protein KAR5 [[Candida] zeylanoides]
MRSSCVSQALAAVLPRCISLGADSLDTTARRAVAIRLSVCEFEAAGVGYPLVCVAEDSVDECMGQLEESPQYWTTFSGNYRDLAAICYQEAVPYEKDHIIQLYTNITKAYSQMMNSTESATANADRLQQQFSAMFTDLAASLSRFINATSTAESQHLQELTSSFEDLGGFMQSLGQSVLANLSQEVDQTLQDLQARVAQRHNHMLQTEMDLWYDADAMSTTALSKLANITKDMEAVAITSKEGLQLADSLANSWARNANLSAVVEENLKNSVSLIAKQQSALQAGFSDSFSLISEKLVVEIPEGLQYFNDRLNGSLRVLESQIKEMQSSLEDTHQLVSSLTSTLDVYLGFFVGVGDFLRSKWQSLKIACICLLVVTPILLSLESHWERLAVVLGCLLVISYASYMRIK